MTRVVYRSKGDCLVALTSEGMHKVWEWRRKVSGRLDEVRVWRLEVRMKVLYWVVH